jgi:hypothetical protein
MTSRWVCRQCGVALVTEAHWGGLSDEARSEVRQHGGRDLCRSHYTKLLRYGDAGYVPRRKSGPDPDRAPSRSRAEVLEEYDLIKGSCGSIAQAAARMGMKKNALEMALLRARRAGATTA